jgi:hypothetical protein
MDHRYSFIMELVFGFFMACGGVGFVHLRSGLGLPRSFCCPQKKTKQKKQTKKKKKLLIHDGLPTEPELCFPKIHPSVTSDSRNTEETCQLKGDWNIPKPPTPVCMKSQDSETRSRVKSRDSTRNLDSGLGTYESPAPVVGHTPAIRIWY